MYVSFVIIFYYYDLLPPPPVQVTGGEGFWVLERVLSYGKTALSRMDHRSRALGRAVRVGGGRGQGRPGRHRRKSWTGAQVGSSSERAGKLCRWQVRVWGGELRTTSNPARARKPPRGRGSQPHPWENSLLGKGLRWGLSCQLQGCTVPQFCSLT